MYHAYVKLIIKAKNLKRFQAGDAAILHRTTTNPVYLIIFTENPLDSGVQNHSFFTSLEMFYTLL